MRSMAPRYRVAETLFAPLANILEETCLPGTQQPPLSPRGTLTTHQTP